MKNLYERLKPEYLEVVDKTNSLGKILEEHYYVSEVPLGTCILLTTTCNTSLMNVFNLFDL